MNPEDPDQRELGVQPIAKLLEFSGLSHHDLVEVSPEQLTHKQVQRATQGRRLTLKMKQKIARTVNFALWGRLTDEEREGFVEYFPKHLRSYFLQIVLRCSRNDRDALVTTSARFCDRFRSARLRHKLTRKQLAKKLGVKYHAILDWENSDRQPVPKMAGKIAAILGEDVFADSEKINFQMKIERLRRGWTAEETAKQLGIGAVRYSTYETGRREVESSVFERLMSLFGWKEGQYV